jgi:HNH endonuclease
MTLDAIPERFRRRISLDESGCWLWHGYRQRFGYGSLRFGEKTFLAHKFIFELLVGPVPNGFELHHKCRIRHCCNPDHLTILGHAEHRHLQRRTHCVRGHELTQENRFYFRTGINAGKSCCLICRREACRQATRRWRERQNA